MGVLAAAPSATPPSQVVVADFAGAQAGRPAPPRCAGNQAQVVGVPAVVPPLAHALDKVVADGARLAP